MEKQGLDYYRQRRSEKHKKRQQKQIKQISIASGLVLLGLVIVIVSISKPSVAKVKSTVEKPIAVRSSEKIVMAKSGTLKLLLPISTNQLTAVGFHEAFNPQALSLQPKGKKVNIKKMSKDQVLELKRKIDGLVYSLMWRGNRGGPLNSSVDVGSKPGTVNHAPVSGRVVQIRKYMLYGRIPDVEVHILPDKAQDRHLVVIHMDNIQVNVGDRVVAALTPIGKTRQLSRYFKHQLSDYSKDAGDPVHYQVNKLVNGQCHQN